MEGGTWTLVADHTQPRGDYWVQCLVINNKTHIIIYAFRYSIYIYLHYLLTVLIHVFFFSFPLLLVVDRNNQTDWFHKFILQEVEFTFYIQYLDTGFRNRKVFFVLC